MKLFIKKLILGKPIHNEAPIQSAISKHIHNIHSIWENEQHDDIGLEKLLRLFLAISQFLFIGTYLKQFTGRYGIAFRDFTVELLVLLKVAFPLLIIINHWQHLTLVVWGMIWLMIETLLHVSTLIFASDNLSRPCSYKRAMLLVFFNYIEIILDFAVIYSSGNYLNKPFASTFDPIYFSCITSATIGYGDFVPVTDFGKVLVCCQSLIFLIFAVLFINFFTTKVENHGYFDHSNTK